jgi:hypothetical protein
MSDRRLSKKPRAKNPATRYGGTKWSVAALLVEVDKESVRRSKPWQGTVPGQAGLSRRRR